MSQSFSYDCSRTPWAEQVINNRNLLSSRDRGRRSGLSSLAALLVPGVELRLSALVSGAFTCRAPHCPLKCYFISFGSFLVQLFIDGFSWCHGVKEGSILGEFKSWLRSLFL